MLGWQILQKEDESLITSSHEQTIETFVKHQSFCHTHPQTEFVCLRKSRTERDCDATWLLSLFRFGVLRAAKIMKRLISERSPEFFQ
jgi:hypothetical protein